MRPGQAEGERDAVQRHLEACDACYDFEAVAAVLLAKGTSLSLPPLPPLLERRAVVSATRGRLPPAPLRCRERMRLGRLWLFVLCLSALISASLQLV